VQLGGYSGGYTKPLGAKIANVSTIRFAQSATQHQVHKDPCYEFLK